MFSVPTNPLAVSTHLFSIATYHVFTTANIVTTDITDIIAINSTTNTPTVILYN
ncbi:hypothetical protein COTS27_01592 [Spirochaetota bacterium]|nr:hypothetical protein COTS27_01592 [Spirochaetota bacterium]